MIQGPPSVLVVDDDENIRLLVWTILREAGFRAVVACDGAEGFALARTMVPDVILCDVWMPGVRGAALSSMLKHDAATALVPVVLMSGYTSAWMHGLDCAAFLAKPFFKHELLDVIGRVLSWSSSRPFPVAVSQPAAMCGQKRD